MRSACNLSSIVDQLAQKYEAVKDVAGYDEGVEEDRMTVGLTARVLRGLKAWWEMKVENEDLVDDAKQLSHREVVDMMEPGFSSAMDFADDAWFTDLLTNGDFFFDSLTQIPTM